MSTNLLTLCLSVFLVVLGVSCARLSIYYLLYRRSNNSLVDYIRDILEQPVFKSSVPMPQDSQADSLSNDNRERNKTDWHINFWQGVSTEMLGAVITTILLTVIVNIAQDAADQEEYRRELIRNAGSSDNGFALQAVDLLREEGWLLDGILAGKNLQAANLRNADLSYADLAGVDLRFADLRGANLFNANLSNADLRYALMQEVNTRDLFDVDEARQDLLAMLRPENLDVLEVVQMMPRIALLQAWAYSTRANLSHADLRFADLSGSDLSFSDLRNANLLNATFNGANLFMVDMTGAITTENLADIFTGAAPISNTGYPPEFDTATLLPDGRRWRQSVDINNFSDATLAGYVDLSVCRGFALRPDAMETNPPRGCVMISVIIPYPERQPGPVRE